MACERTFEFDGWRATFPDLAGWEEAPAPDGVYLLRRTDGADTSSVVLHLVPDATLGKLIRDMDDAPESMKAWINVVERQFVDFGPRTAFRVVAILKSETNAEHGYVLQAQYFFDLLSAAKRPALLGATFTYAYGAEKTRALFDRFFDGMVLHETLQN